MGRTGTRLLLFFIGALVVGMFAHTTAARVWQEAPPPQTDIPAPGTVEVPEDARPALAEHDVGSHSDPFAFILLELGLIIGVAMVGQWLADWMRQPAVLGELVFGVALGNIGYWLGSPLFTVVMNLATVSPLFGEVWVAEGSVTEAARGLFSPAEMAPGATGDRLVSIMTGPEAQTVVVMAFALWVFSNLGVILLLFMVGLESEVDDMLRVGPRALAVAIVGVVTPFVLGIGVGYWLLPDAPFAVQLFLAATMCATSVGITARVFRDLKRLQTSEAQVVLGAAVIDDILGLIILAVVVGIVVTGEIRTFDVVRISGLSLVFLGTIVLFGERVVRFLIPFMAVLNRHHCKLLFPISLAFLLSWMANQIGLATIVGAFAAGLILNNEQFAKVSGDRLTMEEVISPLERIFAPIFFVLMGMQVNLETFLEPSTVWLALAFTVVAIVGKLVAGLPAGSEHDRLSVGIGMVPRGEVGLIFASIGKGLGVVSDGVFSAIVIMVIVTTLVTPLALRWSLFRGAEPQSAPDVTGTGL